MREAPMAETSEFQLEHDLDAWWDLATANGHSLADPEPIRPDIATVRYLSAYHNAPNPDPAFVRGLKDELMKRSSVPNGVTSMPVTFSANSSQSSVATRVRNTFWPEQRRRLWGLIEFASAAALILAFLGAAFVGGPFNDLLSLWPQTAKQTEGGLTGMYRGNAARTGVVPGPGPEERPELLWSRTFEEFNIDGLAPDPNELVTTSGDRIYLAQSMKGQVIALDAATGNTIWTAPVTGGFFDSIPAIGNGLVYVAVQGGQAPSDFTIVALDAATGTERWRFQALVYSFPALSGDTVFVTEVDGRLLAINALTGQERWRLDLPRESTRVPQDDRWYGGGSPAVSQGVVYAPNHQGTLFAVDAKDGHELWRYKTDGNAVTTPAIEDATAYFTAYQTERANPAQHGWVYAVDTKTGKERWRLNADDHSRSAPVVADGLVILGRTSGTHPTDASVTALDASDGHLAWTYQPGGPLTSNLTYAQGVVYGTSDLGWIFALDARGGALIWRADTGHSFIQTPTVADGLMIVPESGGTIYAYGGTDAGSDTGANPGLPTCQLPQRLRPSEAILTPTATLPTLIPGRDHGGGYGYMPQILASEIPQGKAANSEAVAGILETIKDMAACDQPEVRGELYRFYTDNYFRRPSIRGLIRGLYKPRGPRDTWGIYYSDYKPRISFDDARELPDGRVGVLFKTGDSTGWYVIFVEQDGRWLIDERYDVVPGPATPIASPEASPNG
jgi:outer membrane protein assembly factor BamB